MKKFIENSDLNEDMSPQMEWMSANSFDGVLFIESPGKDDFNKIVDSFCEKPKSFEIAHCQFKGDFSYGRVDNSDDAFREFFDCGHEEVFINIIFQYENAVVWIPSEHKFYTLFARRTTMKIHLVMDIKKMRQVAISFSRESYFTAMDRKYISDAIKKYFTVTD